MTWLVTVFLAWALGWWAAVALGRANRDSELREAWEAGWLSGTDQEKRRQEGESFDRVIASYRVMERTGASVYVQKAKRFVRFSGRN